MAVIGGNIVSRHNPTKTRSQVSLQPHVSGRSRTPRRRQQLSRPQWRGPRYSVPVEPRSTMTRPARCSTTYRGRRTGLDREGRTRRPRKLLQSPPIESAQSAGRRARQEKKLSGLNSMLLRCWVSAIRSRQVHADPRIPRHGRRSPTILSPRSNRNGRRFGGRQRPIFVVAIFPA